MKKIFLIFNWVNIFVCIEYFIRVGYSIYPAIILSVSILTLLLSFFGKDKEQEEGYTGENEDWFQFNKRIVIRREDNGEPYLIRRTLISFGKWFSIKYHQILLSDDLCPHDHPWPFLTIILKGGYYEWSPVMQEDSGKTVTTDTAIDGVFEVKKWHGAGSVMYRPASWRHRLELKYKVKYYEPDGEVHTLMPAHTLVFTGKVIRDWGFFTKEGWIFWKNYTKEKYC